jgi:hypothetical protein
LETLTPEWRKVTEMLAAAEELAKTNERLNEETNRYITIIHKALKDTIDADGGNWTAGAMAMALAAHLVSIMEALEPELGDRPYFSNTSKSKVEYVQCAPRYDDVVCEPSPRKPRKREPVAG